MQYFSVSEACHLHNPEDTAVHEEENYASKFINIQLVDVKMMQYSTD